MDRGRKNRVATGLSPMEECLLEYLRQGMKRKDIAALIGRSYGRTQMMIASALKKERFIEEIHKSGETWVGEIPGIPSHCVGALQRNGIITVSQLQDMPEYVISQLYEVGPKSIEAIQRYKKLCEAQHA